MILTIFASLAFTSKIYIGCVRYTDTVIVQNIFIKRRYKISELAGEEGIESDQL